MKNKIIINKEYELGIIEKDVWGSLTAALRLRLSSQ